MVELYFEQVLGVREILVGCSYSKSVSSLEFDDRAPLVENSIHIPTANTRLVVFELGSEALCLGGGPDRELFKKMISSIELALGQVTFEKFEASRLCDAAYFLIFGSPGDRIWDRDFEHWVGQWLGRGLVTYHPKCLIADARLKSESWTHLKRLRREMENA